MIEMEQIMYKQKYNMLQHKINDAGKHIEENDPRPEFLAMEKYCRGLGMDVGCGTNRLSPTVLTTDWYPHSHTDLIWNCAPDPGEDGKRYFIPYPFREDRFDFIFASHVLEDFHPDIIQYVFDEWMRMIKPGGYLIILVPDIEGGRYPGIDEVFTEEDDEVKEGKRKSGELKGNPSHRVEMGLTYMNKLKSESKHNSIVVQCDQVPHSTMTLDFVVQKL